MEAEKHTHLADENYYKFYDTQRESTKNRSEKQKTEIIQTSLQETDGMIIPVVECCTGGAH